MDKITRREFIKKTSMTALSTNLIASNDGLRIKEHGLESWIIEQEERKKVGFCYSDIRCCPCVVPDDYV